jgi:hypothetical protein
MDGDNHRVPPGELALLSSTQVKARVGPRCGDRDRTETLQWMAEQMDLGTLCVDCSLHLYIDGQRWDMRPLQIYQTTIPISLLPPEAVVQWVECPRGQAGRTWLLWPSTPTLMSSVPTASTIPESSGTRSFPFLLHRVAVLPAARPLMSSAPTASTI